MAENLTAERVDMMLKNRCWNSLNYRARPIHRLADIIGSILVYESYVGFGADIKKNSFYRMLL